MTAVDRPAKERCSRWLDGEVGKQKRCRRLATVRISGSVLSGGEDYLLCERHAKGFREEAPERIMELS